MMNDSTTPIQLIFVYNADSGLFNTMTDIAHKIFSPDTYQCQLCQITHGKLSMRESWKEFIRSVPYEIEYLHRDEYEKRRQSAPNYPMIDYPAILIATPNLKILLSQQQINNCQSVSALISLIRQALLEFEK